MPQLFEPLTLRDVEFRNRIWLTPMCQYSCEACDGIPTAWHFVHYATRAVGGFGLVLTEATAVAPEGRISPQDAGLWNHDQVAAWRRVVDAVHANGAKIGVQLAHAGRKASTYRPFAGEPSGSVPVDAGGWEALGPSAVAFDGYATPRAMTLADIDDVVDAFVDAARRADEAGFDVVELHAAHGYLLHEFLSPASNLRDDEYGGSFENRARLLLRIATEVRAAWPEAKPLFVRVSATDWAETGWNIDETVRLARELKSVGVDLVDTSTGGNVPADIPVGPNYQVRFASEIRRGANIATGAVGLITEPAQAEAILTEGDADVVLIGRAGLREPYWPLRAAAELGLTWRETPYPAQYTRGAWEHARG